MGRGSSRRRSNAVSRFAIVNGDDLGLSPGINKGIIESYRDGILTSASLIATGEAFDEAAALARAYPGLSVGVHLTLVEGTPVLPAWKIPSLVARDGRFCESWVTFFMKWLTGRIQFVEVHQELEAQIRKVLDQKITIDKLDSHMHLHLLPGIFQIVLTLARCYRVKGIRLPRQEVFRVDNQGVSLGSFKQAVLSLLVLLQGRRIAGSGLSSPDYFRGVAASGQLDEERLISIFERLQPGTTEIIVHPGYRDVLLDGYPKSRRYDRERELRALTSPHVRASVNALGITLMNYRQVGRNA